MSRILPFSLVTRDPVDGPVTAPQRVAETSSQDQGGIPSPDAESDDVISDDLLIDESEITAEINDLNKLSEGIYY